MKTNNLLVQLKLAGLPMPVAEFRFHPERKWRFDFAWPDKRIAVEIEGGTFTRGRHVRPLGYECDCEKYNEAALRGWKVLRFTTRQITKGIALATIEIALQGNFRGGLPC